MPLRLRFFFLLLLCSSGCNWTPDFTGLFDWPPPPPEDHVPERLALGATFLGTLYEGADPLDLVFEDPDIVSLERVTASEVRFVGTGVGTTLLTVTEDGESRQFSIEVSRADRFELLLVEQDFRGAVVVGPLRDKNLLANAAHELVVRYGDRDGALSGTGLAWLELPPDSDACETSLDDVVDAHCFIPEPGSHTITVTVDATTLRIPLAAIASDDIVDLALLHSFLLDEEDRRLVRIDALGKDAHGAEVYGLGIAYPVLGSPGPSGGFFTAGYMTYELDPEAPPTSVALEYDGLAVEADVHGTLLDSAVLTETCVPSWINLCAP